MEKCVPNYKKLFWINKKLNIWRYELAKNSNICILYLIESVVFISRTQTIFFLVICLLPFQAQLC